MSEVNAARVPSCLPYWCLFNVLRKMSQICCDGTCMCSGDTADMDDEADADVASTDDEEEAEEEEEEDQEDDECGFIM